ncbi:fluoride efflux transporter FluC [Microbacterium terricola]|uniref:Fluoride-specific ion channel FluC n=1 Tax=Microbacterium terricola TaxID=344163 RepID=A0ABM8DVL6_9MICO|nr:CrcB family protein [Microbacterium terricola]UYK39773.1 CrcB family protein [Microbacterium terricola]BDV29476.1 hypothetical protein Microterr_01360 [Microbacterium terricola]
MTGWTFAGLVVAGGLGAGARALLDAWVMRRRSGPFPWGILVVNVTGSFLLGLLTGIGADTLGAWTIVLGAGLLGGFTTFSAVSVDTVLLARRGRARLAWANLLGTALLSVTAAGLGILGGLGLAAVTGMGY